MKTNWILSGFALLIALGAAWNSTRQSSGSKTGFIVNQRVFEGFSGKKILESRLKAVAAKHQSTLDSLQQILVTGYSEANERNFRERQEMLAAEYSQLSGRYTEDIWKQINQWVSAYGKEHGYDFIYGATGDGSVMYGNIDLDLSDEVIDYLNAKYEDTK